MNTTHLETSFFEEKKNSLYQLAISILKKKIELKLQNFIPLYLIGIRIYKWMYQLTWFLLQAKF